MEPICNKRFKNDYEGALVEKVLKILALMFPAERLLLHHVKLHETSEGFAAMTDGANIYINPDKFNTGADILFAVLHEIMHVAFKHCTQNYPPETIQDPYLAYLYNMACDNIINRDLLDDKRWNSETVRTHLGAITIKSTDALKPPPLLSNEMAIYAGNGKLSVLETYRILKKQKPQKQNNFCATVSVEGDGVSDEVIQDYARFKLREEGIGAATKQMLREVQAAHGKVREPWPMLIARYFKAGVSGVKYDVTKWNRKGLSFERYTRAFTPVPVYDIIIGVDTSGSMTDEMLSEISKAVIHITSNVAYKNLRIVYCDTEICNEQVFTKSQKVEFADLKPKGGGGTNLTPIFEYANQHKISGAIIFSDMEFHVDKSFNVNYPVIWGVFGENEGEHLPKKHKKVNMI